MGSFPETLIDPLTLHVLEWPKFSLVPRPVRAIRVTRGGLELQRIFPTSLTGDVTSEITEDDWERGSPKLIFSLQYPYSLNRKGHENKQNDHLRENALFFYKFSHPVF